MSESVVFAAGSGIRKDGNMFTTKRTKEEILDAIYMAFDDAKKECEEHPDDRYYVGRYTMICDILAKIPIYVKED